MSKLTAGAECSGDASLIAAGVTAAGVSVAATGILISDAEASRRPSRRSRPRVEGLRG